MAAISARPRRTRASLLIALAAFAPIVGAPSQPTLQAVGSDTPPARRQFVSGNPLPPSSSTLGPADLDPGGFTHTCTEPTLVLDVVPVWAPPSDWTRAG